MATTGRDHIVTATGPAGEVGEPHRVRDGIHLVRKQAGAPPEHRSGYLLWAEENPRANCIMLGGSGAPSDTVLLRLVRACASRRGGVRVSQSAGGPLTAFVDVAYRGGQQSTWHLLADQEREAALRTAYPPDGLVDDPHEHARLTRNHARWHHRRLRQCAGSTATAVLESGPDTARVLGSRLAKPLAHAAR